MELKIYSPAEDGFIKKIEWNYEELKKEIEVRSAEYAASVYTDDSIKNAKADRAQLNKFKDALNGKRLEVRRQMLEPYEEFGAQIKSLTDIVQGAIDNIDGQVKDYENRQRKMKEAKIREFYDENIFDMEKYLPFERVIKPAYLNTSTSMKSIKEEILATIQKVSEGIAVLNEVDSPYVADMKAVFLKTYDIGAALAVKNRLEAAERKRQEYEAERARQKAEREAREKAEAEALVQAGKKEAEVTAAVPEPAAGEASGMKKKSEPVGVLDFRVYVTESQMQKLQKFLKDSGIRYEEIPM